MTSGGETLAYADGIAVAKAEGLVAPYEMRPPKNAESAVWIRSTSRERYVQTEMIVNQYSCDVLKRVDFADNPPAAKAISLGISFHQCELYVLANVQQNIVASLPALALTVTGFASWWMRRPTGTLGVPAALDTALPRRRCRIQLP